MRIGFVRAAGFPADRVPDPMTEPHPEADCLHVLDEGPLQDLPRGQEVTRAYRRVVGQITLAVDGGAGMVMVTCSSASPAVGIARQVVPVPVP